MSLRPDVLAPIMTLRPNVLAPIMTLRPNVLAPKCLAPKCLRPDVSRPNVGFCFNIHQLSVEVIAQSFVITDVIGDIVFGLNLISNGYNTRVTKDDLIICISEVINEYESN